MQCGDPPQDINVISERTLIEFPDGKMRFYKTQPPVQRSSLPAPYVISDEMEPTEQVDGRHYTSKAQFRAVGRAHGLTEVGNDPARFRGKTTRSTDDPVVKRKRKEAIGTAIGQYRAGRRVRLGREG